VDVGGARAASPGPLRAVELIRVRLPLVRPFRSATAEVRTKEALLVHVLADGVDGWGECGAQTEPTYRGETVDSARLVLRDHFLPRVFAGRSLADVRGNEFARAALETALLDTRLRAEGRSLASYLGARRERVAAGVAIGMSDDVGELRELAATYVQAGYRRLKCKIAPGADLAPLAAVRAAVGADIALQADANGSYTENDRDALAALDDLGLQCVEQPLPPDALVAHADLAHAIATPICLDETITSARVADEASRIRACRVVNVKVGRVGGIARAVAVHDVCRARGVDALVGGMLETGVGRAVNVALAALPGFTLTGDLSASDRYFATDLTEPFVLAPDGTLAVPDGPGIGVTPLPDVLAAHTVAREVLVPGR